MLQNADTSPGGWQVRADPEAIAQMQNVKFVTMGEGYHVTLGPSVILYNPQQRAGRLPCACHLHPDRRQPAPSTRRRMGLLVGLDKSGCRGGEGHQDYLVRHFLVNGVEVAKLPRVAQLNTDGVVGLRINHNLDVHVSGFGVEPMAAGSR